MRTKLHVAVYISDEIFLDFHFPHIIIVEIMHHAIGHFLHFLFCICAGCFYLHGVTYYTQYSLQELGVCMQCCQMQQVLM